METQQADKKRKIVVVALILLIIGAVIATAFNLSQRQSDNRSNAEIVNNAVPTASFSVNGPTSIKINEEFTVSIVATSSDPFYASSVKLDLTNLSYVSSTAGNGWTKVVEPTFSNNIFSFSAGYFNQTNTPATGSSTVVNVVLKALNYGTVTMAPTGSVSLVDARDVVTEVNGTGPTKSYVVTTPSANFSLQGPATAIVPGQNFTVTLFAGTTDPWYTVSAKVDTLNLNYVSSTARPGWTTVGSPSFSNNSWTWDFGWLNSTNTSLVGQQAVVDIVFNAVSTSTTTAKPSGRVGLTDNKGTVITGTGTLTNFTFSATPTPTSTPIPTATPTRAPLATPTFTPTATPSPTSTSTPLPTPSVSPTTDIAALRRAKGDLNNDGIVDLSDVAIMAKYWLRDTTVTTLAAKADCNSDTKVDLSDLSILARNWMLSV